MNGYIYKCKSDYKTRPQTYDTPAKLKPKDVD